MFAIIETGGKQYRIKEGSKIWVEKIADVDTGDIFLLDKVLMINEEYKVDKLKAAKVKTTVIKQGKAKKLIIFKYKPKKNYHKKAGHRQLYTQLLINEISINGQFKVEKKVTTTVSKIKKPEAIASAKPEAEIKKTTPVSKPKVAESHATKTTTTDAVSETKKTTKTTPVSKPEATKPQTKKTTTTEPASKK